MNIFYDINRLTINCYSDDCRLKWVPNAEMEGCA